MSFFWQVAIKSPFLHGTDDAFQGLSVPVPMYVCCRCQLRLSLLGPWLAVSKGMHSYCDGTDHACNPEEAIVVVSYTSMQLLP